MSGAALDKTTELFWKEMTSCTPQEVTVGGRALRQGSRVRLKPGPGGDILDAALAGRVAVIEGIDEDDAGEIHVAVVLEDDPGRDLAVTRNPAHRFFFAPGELEVLCANEEAPRRILVAGIGNVFMGDDAFGVAVAEFLSGVDLPTGTEVYDFGIRGIDLAYALTSGYHAAILVDLLPRGGEPGTVYLLEPDLAGLDSAPADSHQMNPMAVLALARQLGDLPGELLIVGCEPGRESREQDEMSSEMTAPVAAAVRPAAEMIVELASRLAEEDREEPIEKEKR